MQLRFPNHRLLWPLAQLLAFAPWFTACAPYRLYWGDVHGHTAHSDGKGTVAEYLTHARDQAKLDFVAVTDHDFGNAHPWRMPRDVWTHTQETVDALTVNGRFVAIAGYEWTSQPKYWSGFQGATPSERLFEGTPRYYNHKNVYFPGRVPYLFSAKDRPYQTPDLLAAAVRQTGGLIHNCHPDSGPDGKDQWDYNAMSGQWIRNTEIGSDVVWYEGKRYETKMEQVARDFLNHGGRTGFVCGSDTHEGKPAARTAVLARKLTREAIFAALRSRRCYGNTQARIILDFKIDGHWMGEEIESEGRPVVSVGVRGTDRIAEVTIIRNGSVLFSQRPKQPRTRFRFVDDSFTADSYYYLRVTQEDSDAHGNPSRAWSSPIWVKKKRS